MPLLSASPSLGGAPLKMRRHRAAGSPWRWRPAAPRPGSSQHLVRNLGGVVILRASSYEDSTLQQFLFVPVQQTALRLALQLLPQARRVLDVGCGTGQLLRRARSYFPAAQLVGVDLAGRWWPPH